MCGRSRTADRRRPRRSSRRLSRTHERHGCAQQGHGGQDQTERSNVHRQGGQTALGVEVWARLRGELTPFAALAPGSAPLTLAQVEDVADGETLVVAFGSDATALDGNDRDAVQAALRTWLPDIEVLEAVSHDWVADPLSGETWPMPRTGQLTGALAELQRPESRVLLAGSDYASGWAGFIDGAIESGTTASRTVGVLLSGGQDTPVAQAVLPDSRPGHAQLAPA